MKIRMRKYVLLKRNVQYIKGTFFTTFRFQTCNFSWKWILFYESNRANYFTLFLLIGKPIFKKISTYSTFKCSRPFSYSRNMIFFSAFLRWWIQPLIFSLNILFVHGRMESAWGQNRVFSYPYETGENVDGVCMTLARDSSGQESSSVLRISCYLHKLTNGTTFVRIF